MSITVDQLETLKSKAIGAQAVAYCPYSKFRVGACFLSTSNSTSTDGELVYHTGGNVENASYPVGLCAERCALAAAVTRSQAHPNQPHHQPPHFKALAVATDTYPPASPCGMCRQFIREFCPLTMPIYMFGPRQPPPAQKKPGQEQDESTAAATQRKGGGGGGGREGEQAEMEVGSEYEDEYGYVMKTLAELLPMSFGPEDLVR